MNEATRRAWSRPELIVIVRGGPEEAVLTTCKDNNPPGTNKAGPVTLASGCSSMEGCQACLSPTVS
jgi:hypothetical protein